jgi:hypothetical protein
MLRDAVARMLLQAPKPETLNLKLEIHGGH